VSSNQDAGAFLDNGKAQRAGMHPTSVGILGSPRAYTGNEQNTPTATHLGEGKHSDGQKLASAVPLAPKTTRTESHT
jgi:hypothetical protein